MRFEVQSSGFPDFLEVPDVPEVPDFPESTLAVLRVAHAGNWELKASLASALSTGAQHLPGSLLLSMMRWLFVGEALVLRKEQRILVFIVLNRYRASRRHTRGVECAASHSSRRVARRDKTSRPSVKPHWQSCGIAARG